MQPTENGLYKDESMGTYFTYFVLSSFETRIQGGYALNLKASTKTPPFALIKKTLHFESFSHVKFSSSFGYPSAISMEDLIKSLNVLKLHYVHCQYINCHVESLLSSKAFTKFQLLLLFAVFPYQVIRSANIFAKVSLLPNNFAPGRSGRQMNLVKMGQEEHRLCVLRPMGVLRNCLNLKIVL